MLSLMICQTKHKRKNKCSPNLFRLLSRENVKKRGADKRRFLWLTVSLRFYFPLFFPNNPRRKK